MRKFTVFSALLLLFAGCGGADAPDGRAADSASRARQIAHEHIIVDTHIDVPYRLEKNPADVGIALDSGDFDHPRAVAGGLNVAFMSIYTPADLEAAGGSFDAAEALIDRVLAIVERAPDRFAIARSPAEARAHFAAGRIALPMGMENGSPLAGDLDRVGYFFDRGIRYITLAHSKSNDLADSSYDDERRWQGLSEFGVEVVREMNRLGMMVDVSHLSDDAFYDVIELSRVPVIASHSSARHFTPGFERNMSDAMIRALAQNGGLIMINFGSSFLTAEANAYSTARSAARDEWKKGRDGIDEDELEQRFNAIWAAEHGPYPYAELDDVLDHIDHVVALVGVDHVGIGSDYDGVGDSLPIGLKDVSSYPNLVAGLIGRGYDERAIAQILGENLLRVWAAIERGAVS